MSCCCRWLLCAVVMSLAAVTSVTAQGAPGAPYGRPAGAHEVDIERSIMVPMRDSVRIATDVYRPKGVAGPLPTILIRLPYNKASYGSATVPARFFASHGYAVVVQDVRGKFASEGQYRVYEGDMTDWSDTFDWIGAQPWSTGRIGSYGCSYLGEGQIVAAQQRHPRHMPRSRRRPVATSGASDAGASSGARSKAARSRSRSTSAGCRSSRRRTRARRPMPNVDLATFFKIASRDRHDGPCRLAIVGLAELPRALAGRSVVGQARLPHRRRLRERRRAARLVVVRLGAGGARSRGDLPEERVERPGEAWPIRHHLPNGALRVGGVQGARRRSELLEVGDARLRYWETYLAWFDRWFKGNERAIDSLPRILYYVIGRNEWRRSDTWPVKGMRETPFYLSSNGGANTAKGNGRLSLTAPSAASAQTRSPTIPPTRCPRAAGRSAAPAIRRTFPGRSTSRTSSSGRTSSSTRPTCCRDGLEMTGLAR